MKNLTSLLLFGLVLIVAAVAIYFAVGKKAVYAPGAQTQASPTAQPSLNSDLQNLDNTDPNSLNSDLQQLDSQSSSL